MARRTAGINRATERKIQRKIRGGTHLLPTEMTMHRELIDGQDCITVQFEMPNVTFAIPLGLDGWEQFIEDIGTLIEKGNPKERRVEDRTASGLVIPGRDEVEEHGKVPRVR